MSTAGWIVVVAVVWIVWTMMFTPSLLRDLDSHSAQEKRQLSMRIEHGFYALITLIMPFGVVVVIFLFFAAGLKVLWEAIFPPR